MCAYVCVLQTLVQYVVSHLISALPTVGVCLLCHFFTLASFCADTLPTITANNATLPTVTANNATSDSCGFFAFSDNTTEPWSDLHGDRHAGLVLSQNFVALQFVVYLGESAC
jgi:hypothetical protein